MYRKKMRGIQFYRLVRIDIYGRERSVYRPLNPGLAFSITFWCKTFYDFFLPYLSLSLSLFLSLPPSLSLSLTHTHTLHMYTFCTTHVLVLFFTTHVHDLFCKTHVNVLFCTTHVHVNAPRTVHMHTPCFVQM